MIYELRSYVFRPGTLADYLATLERSTAVLDLLRPNMVGFWQGEDGMLNRVVHLWRFEDRRERAAIRARNALTLAWQEFVSRIIASVAQQQSRFFRGSAHPFQGGASSDVWYDLVSLRLQPGAGTRQLETMASGMAQALASSGGLIAHLAEDGYVPTELAFLLRSSSLEEREARCRDTDLGAIFEAGGGKARIVGVTTDLLRPVAFSPSQ
jgi:hypothetical protein